MGEYLQETYVGAGQGSLAPHTRQRVEASASDVTAGGHPIRLIRSMLVPEDETWFLLWEADSSDVVREVALRSGVACDRVTEVVPLAGDPRPATDRAETGRSSES